MQHKLKYSVPELLNSCVYSSIAHAVSNLKFPLFAFQQSWDNKNYCFQYGDSMGVITFDDNVVAAFRNDKSFRMKKYPFFRAVNLLPKENEFIRDIAINETFKYLYEGVTNLINIPVVTTAMWSIDDNLYSLDDKDVFIANGGEFIDVICNSIDQTIDYWNNEYEFSVEETTATKILYNLKCNGVNRVNLNELPLIIDKSSIGYKEFVESLKEIGLEVI